MKVTEAGGLSLPSDLRVVVPAASSKALLQNAPRAVPLLGVPCVVVPVETSRYFGQATGRDKKNKPPQTSTFVYLCVQFSLHRARCCVLPGFGSLQRSCAKGCACSHFSAVTRACPGMGTSSEPPKFPVETLWQVVVAGQGGNQNSREGCVGRQPQGCKR